MDPGSFQKYVWQDGSTSRQLSVNDTGRYSVTVTDQNGCSNTGNVHISTLAPVPLRFLPTDTALCTYSSMELRPQKSFDQYRWSDGNTSTSLQIKNAGTYWLEVTDSYGCIGRDTIKVSAKNCMNGVYIPNAFSPNNDGINDRFKAMSFGPITDFELYVYNRWGEVVFHTKNSNQGWDGSMVNKALETGNYVWLCRYRLNGQELVVQKGTVLLLR